MPTSLPPATPKPCDDCPWLRSSLPGWLGPFSPHEWVELAHGEQPIACHKTIKNTNDEGEGDWTDPAMRQCRGAAIYRTNVCKSPRDSAIATIDAADRELVFSWRDEFIQHHDVPNGVRSWGFDR